MPLKPTFTLTVPGAGRGLGDVGDLEFVRSVVHSCSHAASVYVTGATRRKVATRCSARVATRCNPCTGPDGCVLCHMTQTLENPPATTSSPQERVDAWLADFEAALAVRDIERVVAKFAVDSFWRDLVSFTWNLKTVEGRDGIADMLDARLAETGPSGFRTRETPTDDGDGDLGVHRVRDGRRPRHRAPAAQGTRRRTRDEAWTLLTAMQELKGHEERKGATRVLGAVHGSDPDTRSWAEKRADEEAALGRTDAAVHAGGRRRSGRHRARRPAAPARCARDRRRPARTARRPVAQALQVAVPARPGLVRPPAVPAVPAELAGVRAEGQDRRLAGVLHPGHGGAVLVEDHLPVGVVRRGREAVDRRGRPRRRAAHPAPHAAGAGHRHVGQAERADVAGAGRLPRRAAPFERTPGPGPLRRQARRGDRVQQLRARHLQGAAARTAST